MSPRQVVALPTCTSTNDVAVELAKSGAPAGTLVVTDVQTQGRGRQGRVWDNVTGNLACSLIARPALALAEAPYVALAAGVALASVLRTWAPHATLKWPNDVLVDGAKLAGVLVESQSHGGELAWLIIGLGVNIVAAPPGSNPRACLAELTPQPPTRDASMHAIVDALDAWIGVLEREGVAAIVEAWLPLMDRQPVRVQTAAGLRQGVPCGLSPQGALRVMTEPAQEIVEVTAGDVELVPIQLEGI